MILPPKCDKVWSLIEDSFILNNLVLKKTDLQKLLNNKLSKNKGYDAVENRRQHLLGAEWKRWDSHEKLLEWETRKSISAETKTFILDRDNNKILIDYEDYESLIDYNWINKVGYAVCCVKGNYYFMHRILMDNPEDPFEIDRIDKNRLNNKKSNLRLATRSQKNVMVNILDLLKTKIQQLIVIMNTRNLYMENLSI